MAKIAAFRALRYDPAVAGPTDTLVCPPYDIISPGEHDALLGINPLNMVRLELPGGDNKYASASADLTDWLRRGILREDPSDSLYIYEEEFTVYDKPYKINGIISRVFLEDFASGVILPHEETLSKAKEDRFSLMSATYCNFSQIYSLYNGDGGVCRRIDSEASREPDVTCKTPDGITHRLWLVSDPTAIEFFTAAFADKKLFIADGHHRYETGLRFRESLRARGLLGDESHPGNYIMMMLVDMEHPGLVVFPTHRLVRGIDGFDAGKIPDAVSESFNVRKMSGVGSLESVLMKNEDSVAFYAGGDDYYIFTLKDRAIVKKALPNKSDSYCSLDVAMLHSLILEPLFGIDKANMASQRNLTYTRDISEAVEKVGSGDFQCALFLNPTKVSQIRDVSLASEKMPQKSTYFYPKIITGLVINKIMDIPE